MMTRNSLLRLSIGSDLEQVDLVGVVIQSTLEQIGVEADQIHWLVMAVREAVINAIQHGNRLDADKRVLVEVDLDDAGSYDVVVSNDCGSTSSAPAQRRMRWCSSA